MDNFNDVCMVDLWNMVVIAFEVSFNSDGNSDFNVEIRKKDLKELIDDGELKCGCDG